MRPRVVSKADRARSPGGLLPPALSVVNVMKLALDQPGRMEHTGVGSTEPRYKPESRPENRARNRRVEIVHVAQRSNQAAN